MNDFIELGKIAGFFGVKGWVKLFSHTRPRSGIGQYSRFFLGTEQPSEPPLSITFTEIKESGKYIVGHIKGVNSRDEAQAFLGKTLFIQRSDLPKLDNEYYWHELIGLTVINQENHTLGKIVEMMETGANDVMVIRNDNGEEALIPYVMAHFVLSVDTEKGEMHVDWELDDEHQV